MARRAQSEDTICKLRRDGLDRQRESIHRRHGRRSAGNAGGGQRQGMRQKHKRRGLYGLRRFFVILYNGKIIQSQRASVRLDLCRLTTAEAQLLLLHTKAAMC